MDSACLDYSEADRRLRRILGWDGEWYLKRYPDIAEALDRGEILDPFHHYLIYGRLEDRFVSADDERERTRGVTSPKALRGEIPLGHHKLPLSWRLLGEPGKTFLLRIVSGFFETYMAGDVILDIGFKGESAAAVPVFPHALGVDLDFPGYDGVTLPFADLSVDSVFASHVLEHVPDYKSVLRDWFRVLKPGGFLVCVVPHKFLYERKSEPPSRWNPDHRRFYTSGSLLREFEESLGIHSYDVMRLVENDHGYDYRVRFDQHAAGCYEIEFVIQKKRLR